jgi:hypothetical protein
MRKDIKIREVTDIAIALVPRLDTEEENEYFWDAWIINLKPHAIRSLLINSTGYGERDGVQVKTSTMRFFWEVLEGGMAVKIEPVQTEFFDIASEYWISFSEDDYLYDRKFVFMPGAMHAANFTQLPVLDRVGVMIK